MKIKVSNNFSYEKWNVRKMSGISQQIVQNNEPYDSYLKNSICYLMILFHW
jgi:hypothetical protein